MSQNWTLPSGTDSISDARLDWNNALQALQSIFSGSSPPGAGIRIAFQFYGDTTNDLVKQRDSSDAAWLVLWDASEGPRYMVQRVFDTALTNQYVFVAPFDCTIRRVSLLSNTSTTSDASNYYSWQVRNTTAGQDLLSAAQSTNGNDLVDGQRYEIVVDQNQNLSENDVLRVSVSVTGSPTSLASADVICVVEYTRR